MAKSRKQKEKEVKELSKDLNKMRAAVFADFTYLKVADMEDLRNRLSEKGAVLKVVKKSLLGIALDKHKTLKKIKKDLEIEGPLSLAFGFEDEIAPAKILSDFKKEHKKFQILGGILDNKYISGKEILNLASLSSKEELQGKTVYLFASPIRGFVNVLSGNICSLINILKNIEKSEERKT